MEYSIDIFFFCFRFWKIIWMRIYLFLFFVYLFAYEKFGFLGFFDSTPKVKFSLLRVTTDTVFLSVFKQILIDRQRNFSKKIALITVCLRSEIKYQFFSIFAHWQWERDFLNKSRWLQYFSFRFSPLRHLLIPFVDGKGFSKQIALISVFFKNQNKTLFDFCFWQTERDFLSPSRWLQYFFKKRNWTFFDFRFSILTDREIF